jgi:hypothetical protein
MNRPGGDSENPRAAAPRFAGNEEKFKTKWRFFGKVQNLVKTLFKTWAKPTKSSLIHIGSEFKTKCESTAGLSGAPRHGGLHKRYFG